MSSSKRLSDTEPKSYGTKQVFRKPRAVFLPDIFDGEILKITVGTGEEAKQYKIDRGLLSHTSPFFRAASTNGFFETASGHVELPEDKPIAFDIFLHWANTSKVLPILDVEVTKPELYLHAMVTADKLLVPDLVQKCWTEVRHWFSTTEFPTPNFINELYALNSSIYCVSNAQVYFTTMVRVFIASNMHFDKWETVLACNESFAADVARRIAAKKRNRILKGASDTPRQHYGLVSHPFCKKKYAKADDSVELDSKTCQILEAMDFVTLSYNESYNEYWNPDTQFSTWTLTKPSKEDMIAAGFYNSPWNQVLCILCGKNTHRWEEGGDPLEIHRLSNCEFMILFDSGVRVPLLTDFTPLASSLSEGRHR